MSTFLEYDFYKQTQARVEYLQKGFMKEKETYDTL